CMHGLEFPWTF
nr:immunoglobulin light chain junction region [Macaca mulatta]